MRSNKAQGNWKVTQSIEFLKFPTPPQRSLRSVIMGFWRSQNGDFNLMLLLKKQKVSGGTVK